MLLGSGIAKFGMKWVDNSQITKINEGVKADTLMKG